MLEEFAIEGTARAFHLLDDPTPDGRWSVAEYARAPYRTRLLVLRPEQPADANGTVVVGWQNVSAGYESGAPSDGEIYEGYAWVGELRSGPDPGSAHRRGARQRGRDGQNLGQPPEGPIEIAL